MNPMIIPTRIMYFCSIRPVACAKAFGGVEIGSTIANDEQMATPMSRVLTPPNGASVALVEIPARARIGNSKFAVAVWLMKFAIAKHNNPLPIIMSNGDHEPNGIVEMRC